MNENYKVFMNRFVCPAENEIRRNIRDMRNEVREKTSEVFKNEIDQAFIDIFGSAFEKDCKIEKLEGRK